MLSKKEIALMSVLLQQKNSYVSSKALAEEIKTSDRTARKYLNQLAQSIKNQGATITSKQGQGYLLTIERPIEFEVFWQEVLASKKKMTDITQVEEADDRQHYVLNKLFFEDPQQSFHQLTSDLFVSKTTLSSVLTEIKKRIKPYGLTLETSHKSIWVNGKEEAIRHFIMDYFFLDSFDESMFAVVGETLLDKINFAELTIFVLDECRDANLRLSDFVIHNLVLHIALMIKRIRSGYPLDVFPISKEIEKSLEYEVATRILRRVESALAITFPKEEANYIALHLKVKHSATNLSELSTSKDQLVNHLKEKLNEIAKATKMPLDQDSNLINGLLAHFNPLLIRVKNKIQLANPLIDDVKAHYPDTFYLTKKIFKTMPELVQYDVGDDEWAYIALHIMAAIERYSNRHKLQVLVVCATGYGSAMMLKNRLEKEFSGSIKIADVVSYYEINEERLENIDLIISSISLNHLLFLTPIIHVSVLLTKDDVNQIRQFIGEQSHFKNGESLKSSHDLNKAKEIASAVFSPDKLIYFKEPITKQQALEQLVKQLNEAVEPDFVHQFLDQISLRESYSPLVFGESLAFPHPAIPMTYSEQIVVGILKHPITWDDKHQAIRFIFLLSPSKGRNHYLKFVSPSLVAFVDDKQLQTTLLETPTYESLINTFAQLIEG
ncbi:BglG family transcription antiterminator [Streptococcus pacificus]|uniref:BglG family transcription antiterminator n=1 Tax=Streptococcus pacificus TaxID=2740577 RepID=A0ABS0ZH24_9STRE|nr:PRD domain-containing protein [Streptococcus pacificus]MBJ8325299.1 BglG family transcription antiterminator [Streptococcus pacificus]